MTRSYFAEIDCNGARGQRGAALNALRVRGPTRLFYCGIGRATHRAFMISAMQYAIRIAEE